MLLGRKFEMGHDKLKIVHIIPTLSRGGAERQLINLIKGLSDSYEISLITLKDAGEMNSEVAECGVPIIEIRQDFSKPLAKLKLLPKVGRIINELKPDLIHAWMFDANFISAVLSPFWARHKLIVSKRNADQGYSKKQLIAERWAYGRADLITVNAKLLRDEMPARFRKDSKTKVIPNGTRLSIPNDDSDALELEVPEGQVVIGQVARFGLQKGYSRLVDVAQILKIRGTRAHFVFVGGRGNIDEIKQKVRDLNLMDYITFTGEVSDTYRYLRQFDIVVLASDYEGMPNVIMEAMVIGKCVVATRVGGVPELIRDGETGFIVEPDNLEEMAARIGDLVENLETREAFGLKAQSHIQRFSIDNMISRYEELYESVLR